MIRDNSHLALQLRGHFLSDVPWELERGVQAHERKGFQGRDFRTEEILSDDGSCAISSDYQISRSFGAVFESSCDYLFPIVSVGGNGADFLAILCNIDSKSIGKVYI